MRKLLLHLTAITGISCTTTRLPPPQVGYLKFDNDLPGTLEEFEEGRYSRYFQIPAHLINLARVKRAAAEPRQGPGMNFDLIDRIFPTGEYLVILDSYKNWQYVVSPLHQKKGWVHKNAIVSANAVPPSLKNLLMPKSFIPKVFPRTRHIAQTAINNSRSQNLRTPKGQSFYAIRTFVDKVLVIIPQTNQLAWLANEDII